MGKRIVIDLEARNDKALKGVSELKSQITQLNTVAVKENKGIEKSFNGVTESTKKVKKGISAIGVTLKAIGIGLIITALATLKDLFSQNQKVVDAFNTSFQTASYVVGQVATALKDIYNALTQTSDQFDALGKVINGVVDLALVPLKLSFYAIKLAVQETMLAWENSFFGDKDQETIKNLNVGITETRQNILDVGTSIAKASLDIYNNFGEAITEVSEASKVVVKELGEVSISTAYEAAKANVELQKSADLAAARQALFFEKFDRQAEKLRQIRDDDRNSIEDRKKANDELLVKINEAEEAMLSQAKQQLAIANANLQKDKENVEFQIAQIEAKRELAAVEAQIEGIRSEQKSNDLALDLERKEIEASSEEERLALMQERMDREVEMEKNLADRKKQINLDYINFAASLSGLLQQIAGKNKAIAMAGLILEKGAAIANVVIKAKESIATATANEAKVPFFTSVGAFTIPNPLKVPSLATTAKQISATKIGAGLAIAGITASAIGQARSITGGGGGGVTSVGAPSIPTEESAPPAFNVVGASATNQLADAIGGQSQQPIQAYVVANDVTTGQSLDRNIIDGASLGD